MSDDLTVLGPDGIRRSYDEHYDTMMDVEQDPTGAHEAIQRQHSRIEELELKVKNLRKGLEIYERERNRYKHAYPEKTGAYFLAGGYGDKDDNHLPQFVEIVPAYGCNWSQVYEKTDKTINYEGS